MAFQSLYRRYRSRTFAEVLGQDQVTTPLRNAVREGRVAHAYLFSGPRGTGKTSTARILAKVLNCAAPVDGEPCGECDACVAVEQGTLVDWLQELDAASNRGIDAMRGLIDRVAFGTSGNRKVIILDEVHMLTKEASTALLKTLEEPPAHVVFVLATTDPQKVLPTIQSRTQKFEFRLLSADVLAGHVRHVIDDAGLDLGDDAVDEAVRRGRGSARDTLSALDQIAAAGGVIDAGVPVDDLLDGLADSDAGAVLAAMAHAVEDGQDPRMIADTLVARIREAFLESMRAPMRATTETDRARAADLAARVSPARLTASLEAIGTAGVDMRQAPDPRIPLEVALVRLCRVGDDSIAGLIARIESLETALANGASPATVAPAPSTVPTTVPPADPPAAAPPVATVAEAPPPAPAEPAVSAAKQGKASAARQVLAGRSRPDDTASDPAPATNADRPPLGRQAAAPSTLPETGDAGDPGDAVAAPPAAEAEPPPSGSAPVPAPAAPAPIQAGRAPTRDELVLAWADEILPNLPRSALFKVGRFVDGADGTYSFALPNAPHRDNCEKRREELEGALSERYGVPIRLQMVVDGDAAPPPATSEPDPPQDEDEIDTDALIDAGDAPSTVDRLTQAFPGAELIDGGSDDGG